MDKKSFLRNLKFEDESSLAKIYDKIMLSERTSKTIFTNEFYPPKIWRILEEHSRQFYIKIYSNGIFEECDRRMLCFSPYEEPYEYPMKPIKIINKSKFKELTHRDYLGALMSVGIIREKIGDVIIKNGICYAAVSLDILQYISENVVRVGKCPCEVEIFSGNIIEITKRDFEEKIVIATSNRLDCVVSSLCNLSRGKAVELINSGKVLMNYYEEYKKIKNVKCQDIITIRGFGKFKISEFVGVTMKNRYKIKIKKYI